LTLNHMFHRICVLSLHQKLNLTFWLDFHGHGWEMSNVQPQVIWTGCAREPNYLKHVIL